MRSDVVVFLVSSGEGESFVLFDRDSVLSSVSDWTTVDDYMQRFQSQAVAALKNTARLDEGEVRSTLKSRGFGADDIDAQLRRARNLPKMVGATVYEWTTRIGATNEHGQTVIAKSAVTSVNAEDRLYTLRCSFCGAEHQSKAIAVHRSACPRADQHERC